MPISTFRNVVLSSIAALLVLAAPAGATHAWTPYHWERAANPFTIKLGTNLTGGWPAHLGGASADWSTSLTLDTTIVPGIQKKGKPCNPQSGRVEVCNGKYGNNGWLGLASIWAVGDHIVQGTVKVNDTYFGTARYNNAYARRHVMCQEVGHTLGLGHQTAVSCMDDVNGLFDPAYVGPDQHDLDQFGLIYGHLDSGTSIAGSTANAGTGAGTGIDSRGRQVKFEYDLGDGRRQITWVVWAD